MPRPTLELSMIVKDAAVDLGRCLDSVAGIVDRITIGDTGSSDETIKIAKHYSAEIFSIPWEEDFSRARNHVLAKAQCDWVLVLDADEMLDPAARNAIPQSIDQGAILGYDVWRWNYVGELDYRCGGEQAVRNPEANQTAFPYPAYFRTLHTRLFRRNPDICFEHCVHETVSDRMDKLGIRRGTAPFLIHHFGYVGVAKVDEDRKYRFYQQLGYRKLALEPDSYRSHLEAGMNELDYAKAPAAALPYFEKACLLAPSNALCWLYAGICLNRLGRYAEALGRLARSVALGSAAPLLYSAIGDSYFQLGDDRNACGAFERARALGDPSALTYAKLGAAEVRLGRGEEGLTKIKAAVSQQPESGELCDLLATAAFIAGQHGLACETADRRLGFEGAAAFHYFLAATLHIHANRQTRGVEILRIGAQKFPEDKEIRGMLESLVCV